MRSFDDKGHARLPSSVSRSHGQFTSLPSEISRDIREGRVLAGDDLSGPELAVWFAQEQEAFFETDKGNSNVDPWYAYMRFLNDRLGFVRIGHAADSQGSILFIGPGSGIEAEAFGTRHPAWKLYFLEASLRFKSELKRKWPGSAVLDPKTSGDISLPDNSQDVVCAFSVLHHIPNVSRVLAEICRVTRPGGALLVREPCSSMGDWRFPRAATPNERGISRRFLVSAARAAGFHLARPPVPIIFNPLNRVLKKIGLFRVLPFELIYRIDRSISALAALNDFYWRDAWYKRFGPSAYFYVFRKGGG